MDKKKHLTDKEFEKMLEKGYDFDDVVGQRVSFSVIGMRDVDGRWKVDAKANFALSVDGVSWADKDIPVSTVDDDYDSALATTMLAMANAINSPRFLASLRRELDLHSALPKAKDIQ